jgi:hypothetical protein
MMKGGIIMKKIGWVGVIVFIMSCHGKTSISNNVIDETASVEYEYSNELSNDGIGKTASTESEYLNEPSNDVIDEKADIGYEYLNELSKELSKKVKAKQIFNYLVETNYQKKYRYMYNFYYEFYTENGLSPFDEAFKITSQPENEFVYKDIRLIESYTYYSMPVEINEIPNGGQGNYYLAIADLHLRRAFELLLFDEQGRYLDSYEFDTRYGPNWDLYVYTEIQEKKYGILILSCGNHGIYLTLVVIEEGKFKEVYMDTLYPDVIDDFNATISPEEIRSYQRTSP